jgi:general secretion pathway protein K
MRSKKGTILVTTLWILALLTLLALGIGMRVGIDVKLMSYYLKSSKAHYLAEAGFRKTMALLEADDDKKVDSLNEAWSCGIDFGDGIGFGEGENVLKDIELGDGTFTVSYEYRKDMEGNPASHLYGASDEEGKININAIEKELLSRLSDVIPEFTAEKVAAILDWRDTDDYAGEGGDTEKDYYEELDNPYKCKNGKFSVPEELLLVKGITRDVYDSIKDIITVYGDSEKVNINTASEKVLEVLIGSDFPELPGKIVTYRNGEDGIPGTYDDRERIFKKTDTIVNSLDSYAYVTRLEDGERAWLNANKKYFKVNSNTFRVISKGNIKGSNVKKTIEAVVLRGKKGTEILYYYEN